jgi:hypothetical protein
MLKKMPKMPKIKKPGHPPMSSKNSSIHTIIMLLPFHPHFFSTCEKITQFLEFCKDQGGKI